MIFNLNLQLQFASLCFLIMICFSYSKHKKLPMLSTAVFSFMLLTAIINVLLDMHMIYCASPTASTAISTNAVSRMYVISILTIAITIFAYIMRLARENRKMVLYRKILYALPFTATAVCICVYPGTLNLTGPHYQWISVIRQALYGTLGFYAFHIFTATYLYRLSFSREMRYSIRVVVLMWTIVFFFHIKYPSLPLVSLGVSLMVFFLYLSFANPLDAIEKETGLFCRNAYQQIIAEKMEQSSDTHVICILLEDMMMINAKFGYSAGNELLSRIGLFIKKKCDAYTYHPWGTVLTVIVPAKYDRNFAIAERIANRFTDAWNIDSTMIKLSPQIGVIECPSCAKTADDVHDIVNYFKESASSDPAFTHFGILGSEYLKGKDRSIKIESLVADAVRNDGFEVFYQPIYSCRKGRFISAEALVRLKDTATIGFVRPDEFIPIAEKKGMICELGEIVFKKVCSFISTHDLKSLGIEYIEINLSGVQCMNTKLPEELSAIMKEYSVEPGFLNLEITETAAIGGNNAIQDNIAALRNVGFSFSMDDFGTGFSNLSQIVNLAYDLIKIDKSLIWPYFEKGNNKARVLLNSVVSMIQQLKISIVAEGIETEEQHKVLDQMGIDYLQGFYFSKPVPELQFLNFIASAY